MTPILSPLTPSPLVYVCGGCQRPLDQFDELSQYSRDSVQQLCAACWAKDGQYTTAIPAVEVLCAVCNQPVKRVDVVTNFVEGLCEIRAECHGQSCREILGPHDLGPPGTKILKITAFLPKATLHASVGPGEAAGVHGPARNCKALPGTTTVVETHQGGAPLVTGDHPRRVNTGPAL